MDTRQHRIATAKMQLNEKKSKYDKSKNYVACDWCIKSEIPPATNCRTFIHRRDQLFIHVQTVHNIQYPVNLTQY